MARRKKVEQSVPDIFVSVEMDALSGKLVVNPQGLNITPEIVKLMNNYHASNSGQASYNIAIEGLSVNSIICETSGKYLRFTAPLKFWEILIEVAYMFDQINSALSQRYGKSVTCFQLKKNVTITRTGKADAKPQPVEISQ